MSSACQFLSSLSRNNPRGPHNLAQPCHLHCPPRLHHCRGASPMLVSVLLKEKQFFISCGPATQPASWLAHVACLRYDNTLGQHIGPPIALCRASGDKIDDWTRPLRDCVTEGEQLVVLLRREHEGRDDDCMSLRPSGDNERDEKEEEDEEAKEVGDEDGLERDEAALASDSSDSEEEVK